jgi:hypothetical protein
MLNTPGQAGRGQDTNTAFGGAAGTRAASASVSGQPRTRVRPAHPPSGPQQCSSSPIRGRRGSVESVVCVVGVVVGAEQDNVATSQVKCVASSSLAGLDRNPHAPRILNPRPSQASTQLHTLPVPVPTTDQAGRQAPHSRQAGTRAGRRVRRAIISSSFKLTLWGKCAAPLVPGCCTRTTQGLCLLCPSQHPPQHHPTPHLTAQRRASHRRPGPCCSPSGGRGCRAWA